MEHRVAAVLSLVDLDANGLADLALSGTLTLSTDNAPLTLGRNKLIFDQRQAGAQASVAGYSPQHYVATAAGGLVQVLGLANGAAFTFHIGVGASGDYIPAQFTNHTGSPVMLGVGVATSAAVPATKSSGRYWTLSAPNATTGNLVLQRNLAANEAGYNNSQAAIATNGSGA